jgi:hypothetical protein
VDQTDETALRSIRTTAERVLAVAWGGPVRLGEGERQQGTMHRSRVLRCSLLEAPAGAPATVIVKCAQGDGDQKYDPAEAEPGTPAWRLFSEWAGTQFLNSLPADPPLCGRVYGGDRDSGLIVLEDLGEGECLADLLQGSDRERVEAGLVTYAASLGRLHAATAGREPEFERCRVALLGATGVSGSPSANEDRARDRLGNWLIEDVPKFREGAEALSVRLPPGFEEEVAVVAAAIREPGPFLAFAPGDTCPDNHRFAGPWLRFFDFEFCGFRHALLDAAYFRLPFPTCWCVNRFPPEIRPRMDVAYRAELVRGCPAAADDPLFRTQLVAACAWWTITTVSWHLLVALEKDGEWGVSTVRQRQILRLDTFAATSEELGHLEAIGAAARAMAARLRVLWPPEAEMPLYPPFRSG